MKEESIILGEMEMGKLKIIENESFFKNESSHFTPSWGPGPGVVAYHYHTSYILTNLTGTFDTYGAFTAQEHNEVRGYK